MFRNGLIALASVLAISGIDATATQAKVKIGINIGGDGRGMSCRHGADILYDEGYYNIRPTDCDGKYYEYRARRNGKRYWLKLDSRDGDIVDRRRL